MVWLSPICSHGNVYFTTTGGIYCLRDPQKTPGADAVTPSRGKSPLRTSSSRPMCKLCRPMCSCSRAKAEQFRARLFNSRGQLLEDTAAEFSAEGPGTSMRRDGFWQTRTRHTSPPSSPPQIGNLRGRARVRIVPPLPWTFTFDDLSDAPVTWVGARYRHVVRDLGGNKALVKVTTIPKGARSRCWFGPSDLSNYTIEADVRGTIADNKMPDIGVIAQGYALDLRGAAQQLQIRSWSPTATNGQDDQFFLET